MGRLATSWPYLSCSGAVAGDDDDFARGGGSPGIARQADQRRVRCNGVKLRGHHRALARCVGALIVVVGVAPSAVVVLRVHRNEVSQLNARFQQSVPNRSDRLLDQLQSYESALFAERAAFELSPTMDLAIFRRLYASLDVAGHQPGMQASGGKCGCREATSTR